MKNFNAKQANKNRERFLKKKKRQQIKAVKKNVKAITKQIKRSSNDYVEGLSYQFNDMLFDVDHIKAVIEALKKLGYKVMMEKNDYSTIHISWKKQPSDPDAI